jgi:glutamate---cysteine ligase / carboxylate-amine ligase
MASGSPALTLGIEEEYLLVDPETRSVASRPPAGFMRRCEEALGPQVTHEFLQSQVEVGTRVCRSIDEAGKELAHLRRTIAACAQEFGLHIIAASTHPWASWSQQAPVELERYRILTQEHQTLARRMVICGMHVHAGVEDADLRIDLMNQATYFLPHLLALSTSSPFWEGHDTGIKAFRPIIFGDLPRSGVPETFESFSEWQETLRILQQTGLCDDATKIWWDLRPSARHPTLELRICDICTRIEDALTVAAFYQAILAFLYNLQANNQTWRRYRRILVAENKWRAQRYGVEGTLADFGRRKLVPFGDLVEELIGLLGEHARELGCLAEIERGRAIVRDGTSADHQLRVYRAALEQGASEHEAQVKVVDWLIEATLEGVPE